MKILVRSIAILFLSLTYSTANADRSAFCQISTEDSGGFYESYGKRVDIISKEVSDRIATDGTPMKDFRISEHDSQSCHTCLVRTTDPLFAWDTVAYCMDVRVSMCDKLSEAGQNFDLQCLPNPSKLQQKKCQDWANRSDKFHNAIEANHFNEDEDPICSQVKYLYNKSHAAKK